MTAQHPHPTYTDLGNGTTEMAVGDETVLIDTAMRATFEKHKWHVRDCRGNKYLRAGKLYGHRFAYDGVIPKSARVITENRQWNDLRRVNLSVASPSWVQVYRTKRKPANRTGIPGVYPYKKRFRSAFQLYKKRETRSFIDPVAGEEWRKEMLEQFK